jgi:hypothetical protein
MPFCLSKRSFSLLLTLAYFIVLSTPAYAQGTDEMIRVDYKDNLLTLTAVNADLKNVLFRLSDEAGVYVRFPNALKKQVSIELSGVSLDRAIKKLLNGVNHVVVYSSSENRQAHKISRIYVFQESTSVPLSRTEQRTLNSIRNYERRIESIRKRLLTVDENSSRGKSYLRQIKSFETTIERLKARLR